MHLTTNLIKYGGAFEDFLFRALETQGARSFNAVTGYVGRETVERLNKLVDARPDLSVKLVVGMAAKEGIAKSAYESLRKLSEKLKSNASISGDAGSDVYWYFSGPGGVRDRGLHAKAYRVVGDELNALFVGSSNFSYSGISAKGNLEINAVELSQQAKMEFDTFFQDHLSNGYSFVPFKSVSDFPIRGASKAKRRKTGALVKVKAPTGFKSAPFVDIDLARNIDNQTQSNLNACFGKGRWARSTGVIRPREWYEVELISPNSTTANPQYPKGDFNVTTSDGFAFEARTQGDYLKNLRSKHDLQILGLWIKGVLEDAGALNSDPQELVTADTFHIYGNSILRLYKVGKKDYVMHFPADPKEL